jgi:outer membrane protein
MKSKLTRRGNCKSRIHAARVIPAEAGIQKFQCVTSALDTGFHRCDEFCNWLRLIAISTLLMVGVGLFPYPESFEVLLKQDKSSYRRTPVSSFFSAFWTPAFAGVTDNIAGVTDNIAGVTNSFAGVTDNIAGVTDNQSSRSAMAKDDLLSLYTLARRKDPTIGRMRARLDASKAQTDIARAQMLPRVDAGAGVNWINHSVLNYGPDVMTGSYTGDNYSIGGSVPIYPLQSALSLEASKASVRAAAAGLTGGEQDMILQITQAYFALLKSRNDEIFFREQLQRYTAILRQAEAMDKAGTGDILQMYDAKARLDSAATEKLKAESQHKLALQQLGSLAGREVTDVKDIQVGRPAGPQPPDMQWWLAALLKQHPTLVSARETLAQTELQRKSAKAGHLPTIRASAGYVVSKGSTFLPEVETRQWYTGLSISLPIYSGGETAARIQMALAAEAEQGFILTATREQAEQRLKQSYLNLEYTASLIASLDQRRISAAAKKDAVNSGYQKGVKTTAELMLAESDHAQAEHDMINARYDHAFYTLELKSLAGILKEADLEAINSLSID